MTVDTGMDTRNLYSSQDFLSRHLHPDNAERKVRVLRRIAHLLAERPGDALQELVNIAVEECNGDSAGVSLEEQLPDGTIQFRWVAVAGSFSRYLGGTTPRGYSPCGTCLDRNSPQHYRLFKPYYDFLGVYAEPILDGILIPWHGPDAEGTIWLVSHRSAMEFDMSDFELLSMVAEIVSVAVAFDSRHRSDRNHDLQEGRDERNSELAHEINNPLQSISNTIFLAEQNPGDNSEFLKTAAEQLKRLSDLVALLVSKKQSWPAASSK